MNSVGILLAAVLAQAAASEDGETRTVLGLHGRILDAWGSVGPGGLGYEDLFTSGEGAALEGGALWLRDGPDLGLYASLDFSRQQGQRYDDDVGDSLRPEAMDRVSLALGGEIDFLVGEPGFFRGHPIVIEVLAGVGLSYSERVEADFSVGGAPPVEAELFEASVVPMAEAGVRAGIRGRYFTFTLGLRVQWIQGPERGEDVTGSVDPQALTSVSFELGWTIRF